MTDPAAEPASDQGTTALPDEVITVDGWAHGGEAVGRLADGRACFVARAIPGEKVRVRVRQEFKRHVAADLIEVLTPSPHRVDPPCPYYRQCGGCQLQHVDPEHQLTLKRRVVVEQLQRIGRIADPPVDDIRAPSGGWPAGYRSWARMAVADDGTLGFRQARSHQVQPVDRCLLLDDATQALRERLVQGFPAGAEVTLMTGDSRAAVAVSGASGPADPVVDGVPPDVGVLVDGELVREPATVHVTIDGRPIRTSVGSFFQAGPAGAEALVGAVMSVVDIGPGDTVADLYAGSGLLSVFLGRQGAHVIAVESDPSAAEDARVNLMDVDADVVADTVEGWFAARRRTPDDAVRTVDVVVLDPPRSGAKGKVTTAVAQLDPRRIVYVACDPAALARDARTLVQRGYSLRRVIPLDLFGHTAHVEAVAVFDRNATTPEVG